MEFIQLNFELIFESFRKIFNKCIKCRRFTVADKIKIVVVIVDNSHQKINLTFAINTFCS